VIIRKSKFLKVSRYSVSIQSLLHLLRFNTLLSKEPDCHR